MTQAPAQDKRAPSSSKKRRKRKEQSIPAVLPEPKDIVSGSGQPLDPGVRRELEERLGHDFSRVRLHTSRDAGALTELLGADAVAVGQDIFFREGTYQPGTADGRHLLAHELLHSVQNPHGLGALRAGRDLGAVSITADPIEREAESDTAPEVESSQATPGWLRYTTVNADRTRLEQIDPATLVDRLANAVVRSLRGDPTDASGRVRMQLARMSPRLQDSVLDRLEVRLPTPEHDRLLEIVEEAEVGPPGLQPGSVPEPLPDVTELVADERADVSQATEGADRSKAMKAEDAAEEQKDPGRALDENQKKEQDKKARDAAAEKKSAKEARDRRDERTREQRESAREQQQTDDTQARQDEQRDQADHDAGDRQQDDVERTKQERKEQRDREEQDPAQASAPGADKRERQDEEKKPADGSKPEDLDPKAKGQPGPVRPEKVDEAADRPDSALSEHGLHEKDEDEGDPREEEQPIGLEAGADGDIGIPADDQATEAGPEGPAEEPLKPEDYLPTSDLDVSSVPTADQIQLGSGAQPAMPTFPAPPPTRAEQVEKAREEDAEAEENEDEPEAETKAPGEERGPVAGEAPQPEHGPASDAGDRTAKDLQTEKPLDQEVGPDPETTEHEGAEPAAEDPKDPERQQELNADGAREDGDSEEDVERTDAKQERRSLPSATASVAPPAGAHTDASPLPDRHPSPAVRHVAARTKGDHEAAPPKSSVPRESGPGAAPSGVVGGSTPAGPTVAAGPGGAPPAEAAAVSPVSEQAQDSAEAQAAPEASLEKDGGGCAPPAPAEEPQADQGCSGGGGGGEQKEEEQPQPPDVSGQDPKTALHTVSSLPPDQAQAALPGVDGAATKKMKLRRRALAASPPRRERPSGAPRTQSAPPTEAPPATEVRDRVERAEPENDDRQKKAGSPDKAKGANPAAKATRPQVQDGADGKISHDAAKHVQAAADSVPTTDPELYKTVGPAPKIQLTGKSDPKRTDTQVDNLKKSQRTIHETGREDASKPMGEDQIYPNAPKEQLHGKVVPSGGSTGAVRQARGKPADKGVAVVAKQERGGQIRAGASSASGQMVSAEKQQQQDEQQTKQQKQTEIDQEVADNADKQTGERTQAAQTVLRKREDWRGEQDKHIEDTDKKSSEEHTGKNKEIDKKREDKDKEVQGRKDHDNKQIDTERQNAEKDAKKKKDEKKQHSGGFFGWVKDKVNQFIDGLIKAVTAVFDAARKAINGLIDGFKNFVNKAIDLARDFAISMINKLADALIALGDVLLAAFPGLRDKFRRFIEGLRDSAIAAVNKLADGLKKAVNAVLDALAAGLNKLLDVLETQLKSAIESFRKKLLAAIDFAQKALALLGKFAALAKDIASDPGGWLSKALGAAKTGIQEYLWGAIKAAVKQWFNDKVQSIIGLGKMIIDVLIKGCISLKQIGKMAWDAVIASLPMMIASIIIEKLVSLIFPAAGAVLAIIQGLMAAWDTISRVISAFEKFYDFLKAVKSGAAACLFAIAVASGVVALLDFITNYLMERLGKAMKRVGARLKGLAQKILKGLKKTSKGARKAAGGAVNRARGAARKAAEALQKPFSSPEPKGPRVPGRRSTSTDRGPSGTRRPPNRGSGHDTDRPPSRTPDREKDRRHDQDEAKREHDRATADVSAHKPRSDDRTPGSSKGDDHQKDKTPDEKPDHKKKKETEAPKRTKPRKPKSLLGRALQKVKSKAKSVLKKVRNAGKALGKKLRNSKLGKALKNGAKKLRGWFKRKRNNWRDRSERYKIQKKQKTDDQKKKEKSKETRLQKILPRVRSRLEKILYKGVKRPIFLAALSGMKAWYRLTSLLVDGASSFRVIAKLNPEGLGGEGIAEKLEEILGRETTQKIKEVLGLEWRDLSTGDSAEEFAGKVEENREVLEKAIGGGYILFDRQDSKDGFADRLRAFIEFPRDVPGVTRELRGGHKDSPESISYRNPARKLEGMQEPSDEVLASAARRRRRGELSLQDNDVRKALRRRNKNLRDIEKRNEEREKEGDPYREEAQSWEDFLATRIRNSGNDPKGTAFEVAFAETNGLKKEDGWHFGDARSQTPTFRKMKTQSGENRRPDVVNFDKKVMYEMKYGDSDISQLETDRALVRKGWHIVYVFSKGRPVGHLEELRKAGIRVVITWHAEASEEIP